MFRKIYIKIFNILTNQKSLFFSDLFDCTDISLRVFSGEIADVCIVNCPSIAVFIERACVVESLLEITFAMSQPTFSTYTKKLNLSCCSQFVTKRKTANIQFEVGF